MDELLKIADILAKVPVGSVLVKVLQVANGLDVNRDNKKEADALRETVGVVVHTIVAKEYAGVLSSMDIDKLREEICEMLEKMAISKSGG